MNSKCYFNGTIMDLKDVAISPFDLGFLRGYGVFDVMRTVNGKLFLFDNHWEKLNNSAKELNLNVPIGKEEFLKILEELISLNGFETSSIRTILTGGESQDMFSPEDKPTFLIVVKDFEKMVFPKEVYDGANVITLEYERFAPTSKNSSYIAAIKNQKKKEDAGAIEIIYTRNGVVSEASTSNVFIVKDGKIITPKDGVLLGNTRNLVIDLVKENGFDVEERQVEVQEMLNADEVFLTATNKNIVPIIKVDEKVISDGKVGKTSGRLMDIFDDFLKKY